MSKRDERKGTQRVPLPRPGGPMQDKRKSARKGGQRGQALRRFRKHDEQ